MVYNTKSNKQKTEKHMNITGAIFDFDGTLFNSMHLWKGLRYRYFDRLGIVLSEEDKEIFKNMFLRESLLLAKERFNLRETTQELFENFFVFLGEIYREGATPKEGVIDFLIKLREKNVKIGIATASGETAIAVALEKFSMTDYFDAIYSTYTVNAPKTQPTVYDVTLEALGTDKQTTWIFEDALYAAKTAKANGYRVVGIYDESEADIQGMKEICDIYVNGYGEIEI